MKKINSILIPLMGILFITAYIRSATLDVIYTDYIRIINSYMPDAIDISPYLQGDIFTRIPITYIERIISTYIFGYSPMFDMIVGAICLGISAAIIGRYCNRQNISMMISIPIMIAIFSLNKWEMLTNGTGWVHFLSYAIFYGYYILIDDIASQEDIIKNKKSIYILPFIIIWLCSGEYASIYALSVISVLMLMIYDMRSSHDDISCAKRKIYIKVVICTMIATIGYMISRHHAIWDIQTASVSSASEVLAHNPMIFISLFVKSFASAVIGIETYKSWNAADIVLITVGLVVISGYVIAIYYNIKHKIYRNSPMILMMIISGLSGHILVTISRSIFMVDTYAMSSRYTLQYTAGIIGLLLTLSSYISSKSKNISICRIYAICASIVVIGNIITTSDEIRKAPYRKEAFAQIEDVIKDYEHVGDDILSSIVQYKDATKIRNALKILKDNSLNIFGR